MGGLRMERRCKGRLYILVDGEEGKKESKGKSASLLWHVIHLVFSVDADVDTNANAGGQREVMVTDLGEHLTL